MCGFRCLAGTKIWKIAHCDFFSYHSRRLVLDDLPFQAGYWVSLISYRHFSTDLSERKGKARKMSWLCKSHLISVFAAAPAVPRKREIPIGDGFNIHFWLLLYFMRYQTLIFSLPMARSISAGEIFWRGCRCFNNSRTGLVAWKTYQMEVVMEWKAKWRWSNQSGKLCAICGADIACPPTVPINQYNNYFPTCLHVHVKRDIWAEEFCGSYLSLLATILHVLPCCYVLDSFLIMEPTLTSALFRRCTSVWLNSIPGSPGYYCLCWKAHGCSMEV